MSIAINWPITTLDFEASSIGGNSYPIEIGIACWRGPGHNATVWSKLIAPTRAWDRRNAWSPQSEAVHGIPREHLELGLDPDEAMQLLNKRCPIGTIAFCDGGQHDSYWLEELADAAEIEAQLHLGSWGKLLRSFDQDALNRIERYKDGKNLTHRAGADAMDHIRILAVALDVKIPQFRHLD